MGFEVLEIKDLPATIPGPRIELRRHRLGVEDKLFALIENNRGHLRPFKPWVDQTHTREHIRAWLAAGEKGWEERRIFNYGIYLIADGSLIGNFAVHTVVWEFHRAELGYWLGGDFVGRGYVSEAIERVEQVLFTQGFHRLEIRCSGANVRSADVAKRAGYRLDGCLRQDMIEQGQYRDTLIFSKLRSEWRPSADEAKTESGGR